ncbi:MAG: hypothetical protein JSS83_21010 [Cyanobacteria bacterium SZAS LIN-3]|nr:hypothetical protein [Cyanobacteria bacterium SZAS LIN-3]
MAPPPAPCPVTASTPGPPPQPQFHSSLASLLPQVNHAFAHTAIAPTQGLDLNLASSAAVVALMPNLFGRAPSVTLDVGGTARTFRSGEHVTAAEYVAIKQVLAGNTQTIVLDGSGVATGGSFALNAIPRKTLELVIPAGVTGIDNFAVGKIITINGDIVNYGSLYGLSTNGQITAGAIFAKDIVNGSGGLISTQLPSALLNSIVGALPLTDLTLGASGGITNAGTISGSRNITLDSGSGHIANFGSVASAHGNINLSSRANADLNIVATGGTFQAAQGDINIRDAQYAGSKNVTLDGGNYLSNNLNIWSGGGAITGSIDNVTGVINTNAAAAHLFASTQVMYLGNNCSLGDPTYVNSGGSIVINGAVTAGEAITILAANDITVQAGSDASISTRRASGAGSDITLVAGANVSTTGADVAGAIPGASPIAAGKTASVDFTSGAGGKIDLSGGTHVGAIIDSGSNDSNAGNVTLAAYANGATGGTIVVPAGGGGGASILASAPGGSGGNVTIVAGANPASAAPTVTIGGAIQTSGVVKSGNISITTANPDSSDNTHVVTWDSSGNVTSGNSVVAGTAFAANGQVATGDLISAGGGGAGAAQGSGKAGGDGGSAGSITIQAGNSITTGNLLAYGGGGGGGEFGGTNGGNGGNGAGVFLGGGGASATQSIVVNGQINSSGGGGGGSTLATAGTGGKAGAINTLATGVLSVSGAIYAGDGGIGGGGTSATIGSGGGGSFGGGGGGSGATTSGGGGGGGYFGGGGGGATSGGGGSGGGAFGVGAGGDGTDSGLAAAGTTGGAGGISGGGGPAGGKLGFGGVGKFAGGEVPGLTYATFPPINNDISITGSSITLGGMVFGDHITIAAPVASNGGLDISQTIQGTSSITVTAHGTGSISNLTGNGLLKTNTLVLAADQGDIGSSTNMIMSPAGSLSVTTAGNAYVSIANASPPFKGAVNLIDIKANDFTLLSDGTVSITKAINIPGALVLQASLFNDNADVTAKSITISGVPNLDMDLGIYGKVTATGGNIVVNSAVDKDIDLSGTKSLNVSGSNQIIVNAVGSGANSSNSIMIAGTNLRLNTSAAGAVVLNADTSLKQSIRNIVGSNFIASNTLIINTSYLAIGGIAAGNPIFFNSKLGAGTIANSNGDLTFNSDLIFHGEGLALLASGNVTFTGTHKIDLSGNDGAFNEGLGGALTIIAGFNFTPTTAGPTSPNNVVYAVNSGSASGGSIQLANTTINTSSSVDGSSAGGVMLVSHSGTASNGSIKVGDIDASATGPGSRGGQVDIFGPGITLGDIKTSAAISGSIFVQSSQTDVTPGFAYVADGLYSGGGALGSTGAWAGNIVYGSLTAPGAYIVMSTGGSGTITAASASAVLTAKQLQLEFGTSGAGTAANPIRTSIDSLYLSGSSQGSVVVSNGSSSDLGLFLPSPPGKNITISTVGTITALSDFAIPGALTLTSTGFTNTHTISAGSMKFTGADGNPFVILNGGSLTATSGNIVINSALDQDVSIGQAGFSTGSFTVSGSHSITINANASSVASINQVNFVGDQNFNTDAGGVTTINAGKGAGQGISVGAGLAVTGNNKVVANTDNLNLQGYLIGNPLVLNSGSSAGTIANSNGDVNISSNLIYHGKSLAILASGNVLMNGMHIIDLSGTSVSVNGGDGGSLTVIAGFNFSPSANTSTPVSTTFVLDGTTSVGGGSIDFSGATINTGTVIATARGGDVQLYAHAGATNSGSIAFAGIDAGGSTGGNVTVIGSGVTAGPISTLGLTSGNVTILSSVPQIVNAGISIIKGNLTGPGHFSAGSSFGGDIICDLINAPAASVVLTTGGSSSINCTGTISASTLSLISGSGGIGSAKQSISTSVTQLTAIAGVAGKYGDIFVNNTAAGGLTLGEVTGQNATLQTAGTVTTSQALTLTGALSLTAAGLTNSQAISASSVQIDGLSKQDLMVTNSGSITATGGNIVIAGGADRNIVIGNGGGGNPAGTFTVSGNNKITVTAIGSGAQSTNQIIFSGDQNFSTSPTGGVVLSASTAPGQAVTVNKGVAVVGDNKVTVYSSTLNLLGTLTANPLVLDSGPQAGTIANSGGNVVLTSNLFYHGQDLAILASGSVTMIGAYTIDLSGIDSLVNGGNGGNLSIISGFNFSPATGNPPGQVGPVSSSFTFGGVSLAASTVNLGSATISTGSSVVGAAGGNVLVVATGYGSDQNNGKGVSIGSIDTSASGAGSVGGAVTIIGTGYLSTGNINSTAATGGAVALSTERPTITGGSIVVVNGTLTGSGKFVAESPGGNITSSMSLGGINAGNGAVSLTVGNGSTITGTTIKAPIIADSLTIVANELSKVGSAASPLNTQVNNLSVNAGSFGTVFVADSGSQVTVSGVNRADLFNLSAKNIVVASTIESTAIVLNAPGGNVSLPLGSIGVAYNPNSTTYPGITINTDTITGVAGQPIIFKGTGAPPINAGLINISITTNTSSLETIGAGDGEFQFAPASPYASVKFFNNGGPVAIDTAQGLVGAFSSVSLGATLITNAAGPGPVVIDLGFHGADGNINGRSIALTITGNQQTVIGNVPGGFVLIADATKDGGNGGSISVTAKGVLVVDPTALSFKPGSGTISIPNTFTGGTLSLSGYDVVSANSGPLVLSANGGGTGGSISINITGNNAQSIGANGTFQLQANGGVNGGTIRFSTQGTLAIDSTSPANLSVAPLATSGNGGSLFLTADSFSNGALSPSGPLLISADGKGTGNGGTVSLTQLSTAAVAVGSGNHQITLSATGGSAKSTAGNGGTVSFVTAGDLTVAPAGINVAPLGSKGNGGSITLVAGNGPTPGQGNLLVTGALSVIGKGAATGGSITLTTNGSGNGGVFVVGATLPGATNGVVGALAVSGTKGNGSISITNGNGGIQTDEPLSAVNRLNLTAQGDLILASDIGSSTTNTINLTAGGKGSIIDLKGTLIAGAINLTSASGNIGDVSVLKVKTDSLSATTGGSVNISNIGTSTLTLNASGSGASGTFTIGTAGGLALVGPVSGGTNLKLTTGKTQGITSLGVTQLLSADTIVLNSGSKGIGTTTQSVAVNTSDLTANALSGAAYLNSTGAQDLLVSGITAAKAITLSASGNLIVNGIVGSSQTVTVVSSQNGSIFSTGTFPGQIAGKSVVLTAGLVSGTIGLAGGISSALPVVTKTLTANAGGVININGATGSPLVVNNSSGSSFQLWGTATTLHNVIATNGDIRVLVNAGVFQTAKGSIIQATNGSIFLEQFDVNRGSIVIGSKSTISTAGVGGGDVTITIGSPVQVLSATPSNVITNLEGGVVYFGAKGISASPPLNSITAKNANVVFSTGSRPATAIRLGGGVSITADPPGTVSQAVTSFGGSSSGLPLVASGETSFVGLVSAMPAASPHAPTIASNILLSNSKEPLQLLASLTGAVADSVGPGRFDGLAPYEIETADGSIPGTFDCGGGDRSSDPRTISGSGSVVYAPVTPLQVNTPHGQIQIAPNSVVLVMNFSNGLAVYDLHDSRNGAVSIVSNGEKIPLGPGRAVVITNGGDHGFEYVNPAQLFAYRNLRSRALSGGRRAYHSEFHTLQAISCVQPLKEMLRSKDAGAQKISGQLLKTSAILLQMGGARFEQIPRPHAIALNPSH